MESQQQLQQRLINEISANIIKIYSIQDAEILKYNVEPKIEYLKEWVSSQTLDDDTTILNTYLSENDEKCLIEFDLAGIQMAIALVNCLFELKCTIESHSEQIVKASNIAKYTAFIQKHPHFIRTFIDCYELVYKEFDTKRGAHLLQLKMRHGLDQQDIYRQYRFYMTFLAHHIVITFRALPVKHRIFQSFLELKKQACEFGFSVITIQGIVSNHDGRRLDSKVQCFLVPFDDMTGFVFDNFPAPLAAPKKSKNKKKKPAAKQIETPASVMLKTPSAVFETIQYEASCNQIGFNKQQAGTATRNDLLGFNQNTVHSQIRVHMMGSRLLHLQNFCIQQIGYQDIKELRDNEGFAISNIIRLMDVRNMICHTDLSLTYEDLSVFEVSDDVSLREMERLELLMTGSRIIHEFNLVLKRHGHSDITEWGKTHRRNGTFSDPIRDITNIRTMIMHSDPKVNRFHVSKLEACIDAVIAMKAMGANKTSHFNEDDDSDVCGSVGKAKNAFVLKNSDKHNVLYTTPIIHKTVFCSV